MNDVRDIKWSTQRPTVPGAYWVRGFCLDSGKERQAALVEVCESEHGLICNLHEPNSERPGKFHSWHEVSECHESFEWSQPLLPASPCPHIATSWEGTSYCRLAESGADARSKLAAFGGWCAQEFRDSLADVDGGSAQDAMERFGVIVKKTVTEPCGDGCVCAGVDDFPLECYVFPEDVAAAITQPEKSP